MSSPIEGIAKGNKRATKKFALRKTTLAACRFSPKVAMIRMSIPASIDCPDTLGAKGADPKMLKPQHQLRGLTL